jgi:hypothetical protein
MVVTVIVKVSSMGQVMVMMVLTPAIARDETRWENSPQQ